MEGFDFISAHWLLCEVLVCGSSLIHRCGASSTAAAVPLLPEEKAKGTRRRLGREEKAGERGEGGGGGSLVFVLFGAHIFVCFFAVEVEFLQYLLFYPRKIISDLIVVISQYRYSEALKESIALSVFLLLFGFAVL